MELLVVLAILGLLMSLVGPRVLSQLGGAKTKTTAIQIKDLEQSLEMYKLDVGRFPSYRAGSECVDAKAIGCRGLEWALSEVCCATGPMEAGIQL